MGLRCLTFAGPTRQVSNAGEPIGALGLPTQGFSRCALWVLFGQILLAGAFWWEIVGRCSCRKLCWPGASSCAAALCFPWAEPGCRWVSCPAGLRAGEGSDCGRGRSLVWFSFPACCGAHTAQGFEEGGRKSWGASRQVLAAGLCAAGLELGPSVLPAVVPVPVRCQVCATCGWLSLSRCIARCWCRPSPGPNGGSMGSRRCLIQGVFSRWGWCLVVGRGSSAPPRWS